MLPEWRVTKVCSALLPWSIADGRKVGKPGTLTDITKCYTQVFAIPS